jgi:1,4-dihydroxy-2-naphthoate octaprenyltransferase
MSSISFTKSILAGIRPKTLIAAFVPPMVAYFIAIKGSEVPNFWWPLLCILSAIFIQISTNFFNDAIDFEKGADHQRIGPKRITNETNFPPSLVKKIGFLSLLIALLLGIPLILRGGTPILIFGALSLYLSYGYTGGPYPLAYKGLGELFVFLFFGLFAVLGSFYIYTLTINSSIFFQACTFGFLSTTLIGINNLRDRETDILVEKRTLATLVPRRYYQIFLLAIMALPYVTYKLSGLSFSWPIYISVAISLALGHLVWRFPPEKLNPGLMLSGLQMLSFLSMIYYGQM